MVLVVQKSTEISQLQYCDEAINVKQTVVQVVRVPQSQVVAETAQQITDKVTDVPAVLVVPVPQVRMVKKTVEDPQFQIVEKTVEKTETQTTDSGLGHAGFTSAGRGEDSSDSTVSVR